MSLAGGMTRPALACTAHVLDLFNMSIFAARTPDWTPLDVSFRGVLSIEKCRFEPLAAHLTFHDYNDHRFSKMVEGVGVGW
jgi:hypothetical protein